MNAFLTATYSSICALSPIFVIYSLVGGSLTILDMLILFFYVISIFSYFRKRGEFVIPVELLFMFVFIHSLITYIVNNDTSIFLRAMHLANLIFFVAFYNKYYFDLELAKKIVSSFAVIATLFLIIQHVGSIFLGLSIPGIISQYAINDANMENMVHGTDIYRFASFFVEPAAFAHYIICALAIELYYKEKANLLIVALYGLGCIMSTSNTAMALYVFLIFLFLYENKLFNKKTIILFFLSIIIIVIAQPYLEAISSRLESGISAGNRFEGYSNIDRLLHNTFWGIGFVAPSDMGCYLAGFARLVVYMGLLGVVVYGSFFTYMMINTNMKKMLLVFLILNIGSDTIFGVSFLYYISFIVNDMKKSTKFKINTYERSINYYNKL